MINQELRTYIETQLARGVERMSIEKVLRDAGWKEVDIQDTFNAITASKASPIHGSPYSYTGSVNVMPGVEKSSTKNGSLKTFIVTFLLLLIIFGAGTFAYLSYFKILPPQTVLANMMSALRNVNTLEYKIEASVEGATCTDMEYSFEENQESKCNAKKPFSNTTTISGISDISVFTNPIHQLTLTSDNTLPNEDGLSEKAMIQIDLISLQKALYIKVSNLVFPLASFFDTTTFINKWVLIDIAGVQKELLGTDPSSNTELISKEKAERIRDVFLDANILSIVDTADEVREGIPVYAYSFEVTKEKQKELLVNVYSILYEDFTEENTEISREAIEEAVAENIKDLGVIKGELWIGKKDFLPYKIVITPSMMMRDGTFEVTDANISSEFKNYNVPVTVNPPSSVVTFEEVMTKLFAPTGEPATTTPVKVAPKR